MITKNLLKQQIGDNKEKYEKQWWYQETNFNDSLEPVLFFVKHAKRTCSRRIYHISPISFWYFWNYEIQDRWCYFAEFAEYLISLPNGA